MTQSIVPMLIAAGDQAVHKVSPGSIRDSANPVESFMRDGIVVIVDIGVIAVALAIVFCLLRMLKGPIDSAAVAGTPIARASFAK